MPEAMRAASAVSAAAAAAAWLELLPRFLRFSRYRLRFFRSRGFSFSAGSRFSPPLIAEPSVRRLICDADAPDARFSL